jgi:hypothetical protein
MKAFRSSHLVTGRNGHGGLLVRLPQQTYIVASDAGMKVWWSGVVPPRATRSGTRWFLRVNEVQSGSSKKDALSWEFTENIWWTLGDTIRTQCRIFHWMHVL